MYASNHYLIGGVDAEPFPVFRKVAQGRTELAFGQGAIETLIQPGFKLF